VLHIFPHWNWPRNRREPIDVWAFSNCEEVALFLNGRLVGRKPVPHNSHVAWSVYYDPGRLEAVGFRAGKPIVTTKIETSGRASRLVLEPDRFSLRGDGSDVALLTVKAVDDAGRFVPTANNLVQLRVTGEGSLLGVGNGDPSSHESDSWSAPRDHTDGPKNSQVFVCILLG
jgi:beta-galactosidase